MSALLAFVPSWLWAALLASMTAVSCTQQLRLDHSRAEAADLRAAIAEGNTRAAEQARALQAKVTEAQNEAKKRETLLRTTADNARTELDGLRGDLDAMRGQLADATASAAAERALAVGAVLQQCAARHQDLAQRCDRHVNDVRTMIEAWPR